MIFLITTVFGKAKGRSSKASVFKGRFKEGSKKVQERFREGSAKGQCRLREGSRFVLGRFREFS